MNVAADHYTDVSWEHFEGPVEKAAIHRLGDTVDCAHISVTYRDGTTHTVFSGILPGDPHRDQTFPEGDSRMKHVDFAQECRWRPHRPVGRVRRLGRSHGHASRT
ncbi:MAG: hypothetical protein U1E93_12000 [Alphaproteobacteria bacterium]